MTDDCGPELPDCPVSWDSTSAVFRSKRGSRLDERRTGVDGEEVEVESFTGDY